MRIIPSCSDFSVQSTDCVIQAVLDGGRDLKHLTDEDHLSSSPWKRSGWHGAVSAVLLYLNCTTWGEHSRWHAHYMANGSSSLLYLLSAPLLQAVSLYPLILQKVTSTLYFKIQDRATISSLSTFQYICTSTNIARQWHHSASTESGSSPRGSPAAGLSVWAALMHRYLQGQCDMMHSEPLILNLIIMLSLKQGFDRVRTGPNILTMMESNWNLSTQQQKYIYTHMRTHALISLSRL